jgi:hypothetical protein
MSLPDPPLARDRRAATAGRRASDNPNSADPAHRRALDSSPRRRSTDPQIRRRQSDKKSGKSGFGALLTLVIAVLFLGYVFNVAGLATAADGFFSGLDASAKSEGDVAARVVALVYPVIGLLVGALILYGIFSAIFRSIRGAKKTRALAGREVISLEKFKRITETRGIRPRIATQAYHLLLPFYASSMRARLDDRLIEDLHMTAQQVHDIYGNLLLNTDRKAVPGEEPAIFTVMDLLQSAQSAKRHSLMDSVIRPAVRASGIRRAHRAKSETEESSIVPQ